MPPVHADDGGGPMSAGDAIGLAFVLVALVYLTYALFRGEKL